MMMGKRERIEEVMGMEGYFEGEVKEKMKEFVIIMEMKGNNRNVIKMM